MPVEAREGTTQTAHGDVTYKVMDCANCKTAVRKGEFDEELATDLEQVEHCHHAGAIEAEIVGVKRNPGDESEAIVTFDPPLGEPFARAWSVPYAPDERTNFALLLESCGQNLSSAPEIIGDRAPFVREDGDWVFAAEWPQTRRERLRDVVPRLSDLTINTSIAIGAVAFYPVLWAVYVCDLYNGYTPDGVSEEDTRERLIDFLLFSLGWLAWAMLWIGVHFSLGVLGVTIGA